MLDIWDIDYGRKKPWWKHTIQVIQIQSLIISFKDYDLISNHIVVELIKKVWNILRPSRNNNEQIKVHSSGENYLEKHIFI